MRALIIGLVVSILSIGAFAIDETVSLKFLLKNSMVHFKSKQKEVNSRLRGLEAIAKIGGFGEEQQSVLNQKKTYEGCRKKTYDMLYKISKMFSDKDALSSAFLTRKDLELEGDDLLSIYDFFIQPYLEYLNYKTDYLTAQVNNRSFRTNEEMPFYVEELNVDGYCKKQTDLRHYGENGDYPEMDLALPASLAINDVKRSKQKIIENEIQSLREFEKTTLAK